MRSSSASYTPSKLAEIFSSILALTAAVCAFEAVMDSIRVHIDKRILPPVLDQVEKVGRFLKKKLKSFFLGLPPNRKRFVVIYNAEYRAQDLCSRMRKHSLEWSNL